MRTYKILFGTLAISFLFELALADFLVWEVLNFDGYSRGYNVWDDSIPTCFEAASRAQSFDRVDDASGRNVGVRCEGKLGCGKEGSPSDIDIFEMNLHRMNPTLHWTIYKNVGYSSSDWTTVSGAPVFPRTWIPKKIRSFVTGAKDSAFSAVSGISLGVLFLLPRRSITYTNIRSEER